MEDLKEITVIGGRGGNGMVSFVHEARRVKGGPDGGDGGGGGSFVVVAEGSRRSFAHLWGVKVWRGREGERGGSGNREGKQGKEQRVGVPVGTRVWEVGVSGGAVCLGELIDEGAGILVCRGGRGGRGNRQFATPESQAPLLAEAGEDGEQRVIQLELRLGADVALVGMPNAGKSALLAAVTNARPRVGDYMFTTVEPIQGTVDLGDRSLTLLELPGLLEGSSGGRGLGFEFLRHAERAKVLVYVVDGVGAEAVAAYRTIHREVETYGSGLIEKPALVVVTKTDLPEVGGGLAVALRGLRRASARAALGISAATGEGLEKLLEEIGQLVPPAAPGAATVPKMIEPPPVAAADNRVRVTVESGVFVVSCRGVERLMPMVDMRNWRARLQFHAELGRLGVLKALEGRGVRTGDTVRIGAHELEWGS